MKYVLSGVFAAAVIASGANAVTVASPSCDPAGVTIDNYGNSDLQLCNISGNDTGNNSTFLADLNAGLLFSGYGSADLGDMWSLVGKSDQVGDVNSDLSVGSGVWSATGLGTITVVTLKAGSEFSAFLFDGTDPTVSGTFNTLLANMADGSGLSGRGLSHLGIFTVSGDVAPVPVPAAGLMLLTALGAGAMLRRRR